MKIYIAGKITGEKLIKCKNKFAQVETKLRQIGVAPVNPFKLGCQDTWTFKQCRPYNFKALRHCGGIFMLNDYKNSPGAQAELTEALRLQLDVFYEKDNDFEHIAQLIMVGTISS